MRVLHIIKVTQIGGAERHLLTLLPALAQRGIASEWLMLVEPERPVPEMSDEAEACDIPLTRLLIRHHADLTLVPRLRAAIAERQPDVVHSHLVHADTYALPAARLAGVKTIVTTRHNDDRFRERLPMRALNGALWRQWAGGIVISRALHDFVTRYEGASPAQLRVIPYGMDYIAPNPDEQSRARQALLHACQLPDDALLVGIAARLVPQKGLAHALHAWPELLHAVPQAHLVIAGDGPLRAELESETDALNLRGRVHFLGWRHDVPHIMAGLDVFLLPSLWEGFGLVLLEAMAQRLPIVATQVSAIPEVVQHGETGLLIPPRDPSAIAEALTMLLRDRALRRHMGLMGEDRLERHFSAARMAEATRDFYHTVTGV